MLADGGLNGLLDGKPSHQGQRGPGAAHLWPVGEFATRREHEGHQESQDQPGQVQSCEGHREPEKEQESGHVIQEYDYLIPSPLAGY